jgi:hypothetical protein
MTAYRPYNLWWSRPKEMPLELDLGISLDPLDVEQYRVPPGAAPELAPEDAALLAPLDTPTMGAGPGFRVGKAKGQNKAGWLMRTLYLSDMQLPKVRGTRVLCVRGCTRCCGFWQTLARRASVHLRARLGVGCGGVLRGAVCGRGRR